MQWWAKHLASKNDKEVAGLVFPDFGPNAGPGRLPLGSGREAWVRFGAGVFFASVASVAFSSVSVLI